MMAFDSLSLGVTNRLPIPALDGWKDFNIVHRSNSKKTK